MEGWRDDSAYKIYAEVLLGMRFLSSSLDGISPNQPLTFVETSNDIIHPTLPYPILLIKSYTSSQYDHLSSFELTTRHQQPWSDQKQTIK